MKTFTAKDVCNLLNDALKLDPLCVGELVSTRVRCNSAIANHKTIQVNEDKDGVTSVGLLGIINGILGDDKICLELDDVQGVVCFKLFDNFVNENYDQRCIDCGCIWYANKISGTAMGGCNVDFGAPTCTLNRFKTKDGE